MSGADDASARGLGSASADGSDNAQQQMLLAQQQQALAAQKAQLLQMMGTGCAMPPAQCAGLGSADACGPGMLPMGAMGGSLGNVLQMQALQMQQALGAGAATACAACASTATQQQAPPAAPPPPVAGPTMKPPAADEAPARPASQRPAGAPRIKKAPGHIDPEVGDWPCLSCGNWNWARRPSCNLCGAQKRPDALAAAVTSGAYTPGSARPPRPGEPERSAPHGKTFAEKRALASAAPSEGGVVPLWGGKTEAPSHYYVTQHSRSHGGPPPSINPDVGDWLCACGNWNWAKRKECNKCRAPREAAASGGKRTGSSGGFREFDADEQQQRKRRQLEEKERNKKERKKCPICFRASCIC